MNLRKDHYHTDPHHPNPAQIVCSTRRFSLLGSHKQLFYTSLNTTNHTNHHLTMVVVGGGSVLL